MQHTFSVRQTTVLLSDVCFYAASVSGGSFSEFQGYNNSKGVTLEACFTPDSQFVMIGKLPEFRFIFYLFISWSVEVEQRVCLVQVRRTAEFTSGASRAGWRWRCWMENIKDPSTRCSLTLCTWRSPAPAPPWWELPSYVYITKRLLKKVNTLELFHFFILILYRCSGSRVAMTSRGTKTLLHHTVRLNIFKQQTFFLTLQETKHWHVVLLL